MPELLIDLVIASFSYTIDGHIYELEIEYV